MVIQHEWPGHIGDAHNRRYGMIIADPPYNLGKDYADDPTGDKMLPDQYRKFVGSTIARLAQYLAIDGVLAWICPADHGGFVWSYLCNNGLSLYNGCPVIWYETFSQYQQSRMTVDYRLIFLAHLACGRPNIVLPRVVSQRQILGDKRADPRGRVPGMVWQIPRTPNANNGHPCQMPAALYSRLMQMADGRETMDAFAGLSRWADMCVDKSPTYCEG